MKHSLFVIILVAATFAGCTQTTSQKKTGTTSTNVGGTCEGCEAIYESPVPFERLSAIDTLPDYNEKGPRLEISGTVYQTDGKTPAKDVVIYVYHTDQSGHYPNRGNEEGWGKRHGYIRGWMKTDANGFYRFYTLKPAAYPGRRDPAHIHVTIKEPDKNDYWIDEYVFEDDPLLTKEQRSHEQNRGGNGVIRLQEKNGMMHGTRHIYLGKNVPGYPTSSVRTSTSGLELAEHCPAFDPLHLSGAVMILKKPFLTNSNSYEKVHPVCL